MYKLCISESLIQVILCVTISIHKEKLSTEIYAVGGSLRKWQTQEDVLDKSSQIFLYFSLSPSQQDTEDDKVY